MRNLFLLFCFYSKAQYITPINGIGSSNDVSYYWIGTIPLTLINSSTTYFNVKKLHKNDKYRSNAVFGVISGCAQTALGLYSINLNNKYAYIPGGMNLSIGLTTFATSILRLSTKNLSKEPNLSLNVLYNPKRPNNLFIGFNLKKEFHFSHIIK